MQEWYALDRVERCRETIPDLTRSEEDLIFDCAMSGTALFLRCSFFSNPNADITQTVRSK